LIQSPASVKKQRPEDTQQTICGFGCVFPETGIQAGSAKARLTAALIALSLCLVWFFFARATVAVKKPGTAEALPRTQNDEGRMKNAK